MSVLEHIFECMAQWDPAANARPVEWVVLDSWKRDVLAIVRVHSKDAHDREPWYKVTTGERDASERKLIGWVRSLAAAGQLVHDYEVAAQDSSSGACPPGSEVKAYRPWSGPLGDLGSSVTGRAGAPGREKHNRS